MNTSLIADTFSDITKNTLKYYISRIYASSIVSLKRVEISVVLTCMLANLTNLCKQL